MATTENEMCRLAGRHSNDILLPGAELSMFVALHKLGREDGDASLARSAPDIRWGKRPPGHDDSCVGVTPYCRFDDG
jgi:hypothetical protein